MECTVQYIYCFIGESYSTVTKKGQGHIVQWCTLDRDKLLSDHLGQGHIVEWSPWTGIYRWVITLDSDILLTDHLGQGWNTDSMLNDINPNDIKPNDIKPNDI